MTATTTTVHELYILAEPERLWEALTNGEMTAEWFYGTNFQCDPELNPGSEFVYFSQDQNSRVAEGKIREAKFNERLEMDVRLNYSPTAAAEPPMHEIWQIEGFGEMSKLTVTHPDVPIESATYGEIASGMPYILSALKTFLECGKHLPMPGYE